MRSWLVVVSVVLFGCAKCGAPKLVADAGAAGPERSLRVERKSIDLHTALIQMYPEYRDTALLDAGASVTREIPGLTPASRDEALAQLRWSAPADGGTGWELNRFHLEQTAPETLTLSLPLTVDDVGNLFLAPTSITSMEMALYLPRQLPVGEEVFELNLHYATSPERAVVRVRQATSLLLANGQWRVTQQPLAWLPDGGGDDRLPERFDFQLTGARGEVITWERERGQVRVRYRLVTVPGSAPTP